MLSILLIYMAFFIGGMALSVIMMYTRTLLKIWLTNNPLHSPRQLNFEYILYKDYDGMDMPTFFVFNAVGFFAPILTIIVMYELFIRGTWKLISGTCSRYHFTSAKLISFLNRALTRKA